MTVGQNYKLLNTYIAKDNSEITETTSLVRESDPKIKIRQRLSQESVKFQIENEKSVHLNVTNFEDHVNISQFSHDPTLQIID